jgi:protein-disulfide isomerase
MVELLETTVDHVRGGPDGRLILEYGDYECPFSRRAFRAIERVERRLGDGVRFAFRHFPLTEIHPHAYAAAAAAEAARVALPPPACARGRRPARLRG